MEDIGRKIRRIREAQNLTRQEFAEKTGLNIETISATERGKSKPNSDKLQAICRTFPQYTLWLMTDQSDPTSGQITPEDNLSLVEKLQAMMNAENINAEEFTSKTGLNHREQMSATQVQAICRAFPQYTLWLMTDQSDPTSGQISPEDKAKLSAGDPSQKTG